MLVATLYLNLTHSRSGLSRVSFCSTTTVVHMTDEVPEGQPEPPPSYVGPQAWLSAPLEPRQSSGTADNAGGGGGGSSSTAPQAHVAFQHRHGHLGLPSGFFILRNKGTGRVLDLLGHKTAEGSEVSSATLSSFFELHVS